MASLNDITEDPFMGYNEDEIKPKFMNFSEDDIYGSYDQVVPTRDVPKHDVNQDSNSMDEDESEQVLCVD